MAIALVVAGFVLGHFVPRENNSKEAQNLRLEVQEIRQTGALTLLKQDSPSDRLMGVSWSSQLEKPGEKTLTALLDTLENDPNVNVRLSAVDALYLFSENPMVKKGLISTLQKQESPLVQIALIDLLVDIREKRAVKALKGLIKNRGLTPQVREKAQFSIQQLI